MAQKPTQEHSFDIDAALAAIHFTAPAQARNNLVLLAKHVPVAVLAALVPLLGESANPDAALNLFQRLACENSEIVHLMEHHPFLVHYAVVVFGNSQWLGDTLIKNPDLFHGFVRERSLDRQRSREDFQGSFARTRSRSFETDIAVLLARFRRREYVRIMLRDLLQIATLAETTAEISALSDVLIEEALISCDSALRNRYGPPQHQDPSARIVDTPFAVLSMGKLGGNELNYSSDIDLLYLYGDGAPADRASVTNREYFVRLAQEVTGVLSRITPEGPVFRIDLRLRPQGTEGESAIALNHALRYYSETARDWELQALIKVRHSAGDQALAREFIRKVQPHVYRAELNFAAIETAREALARMSARRKIPLSSRRADTIDVKLDRGGIRDIEFLVQCLQRVYGGAEPWLRSGGTLFSLQKLHDKNHITGKDFHELTTNYEYLRAIEHRLQLRAGQQTHRLPKHDDDLRVLHRSISGLPHADPGSFVQDLRERMNAIAEIYDRIIHKQEQQAAGGELKLSPAIEGGREQSYNQILSRLALDAPQLYRLACSEALPPVARRNLYRFLGAASTNSERYATVIRESAAVERALTVLERSEYLTELLLRHPDEVASLNELPVPRANGSLFGDALHLGGQQPRDPVFAFAASVSAPEAMALLRRQYRHRIFVAGARELLQPRSVYDSLEETTHAADEAISTACQIAAAPPGFAVMAFGRLGTREFDVLSDADLLFVRDASSDPAAALRAAERIVEVLSAYTKDGTVFPVDARLRPHGAEGELVTTPAALRSYFSTEAHAWEGTTYTKLRFISGHRPTADRALAAIAESTRFTGDSVILELREMRSRLAASAPGPDLKLSPGGLYDIDFLVGFLSLTYSLHVAGNLHDRLLALSQAGALSDEHWQILDPAAELLRATEHAVRLVDGRSRKWLPSNETALKSTESFVQSMLRPRVLSASLEAELRATMVEIREVYKTVLGD